LVVEGEFTNTLVVDWFITRITDTLSILKGGMGWTIAELLNTSVTLLDETSVTFTDLISIGSGIGRASIQTLIVEGEFTNTLVVDCFITRITDTLSIL